MKTRLIIAGLLVACAIAASAAPALGDSEGTVAAQVTVADACVQITPSAIDFGTLVFTSSVPSGGTRPVTVTNCSAGTSTLLARGTNASSSGGTTWTLEPNIGNLCSSPNRFAQVIREGGTLLRVLSTVNDTIKTLAASEAAPLNAELVMPCTGSSGAGEVMTFSYVFTVTLN